MVFTFQLLVSFTASVQRVCTVCLPAFIVRRRVNREGKKTKVDSQCNYRLTGMEMREAETKVGESVSRPGH